MTYHGIEIPEAPLIDICRQHHIRRLSLFGSVLRDDFRPDSDVNADESNEKVDTVVQPDLLVVCDQTKIEEKCVRGAPDLTIEILSESTTNRDLRDKLFLYEKHGVRCYIIVDPWSRTCIVRDLAPDGKYGHPEIYAVGDIMPIRTFPDLTINLARVFA